MSTTKDPSFDAPGGGGRGGEANDADLHDAFIARALAQAPDRSTLPDWRVRQAILDHAHDAVAASEALLTASRARTAWWNIGTWFRSNRKGDKEGERRGGGAPWTAALATVVVGVLVTLVWQREPVPGAKPDAEPSSQVARQDKKASSVEGAGAPSSRPAEQESASQRGGSGASSAPAPTPAPAAPAVVPAPAPTPAPAPAPSSSPLPWQPSPPAEPASPSPTAAPPPRVTDSTKARLDELTGNADGQSLSPSQMQQMAKSQSRIAAPPMPMSESMAPSAPSAAPSFAPPVARRELPAGTSALDGFGASGEARERAEAAVGATAKDSSAAAAAAATAANAANSRARAPSSLAPPSAPAASAIAPAPGAPATAAAPEGQDKPPPNYVSLARWTELHIASVSGQMRTAPRVEGSELIAQLNAAAAQPSSGEALRELPQWRVSLERKGDSLALLEVGRSQLRWSEGANAPVTSRPPPAMMEALHAALREAVRAPSGGAGRARK